MKIEKTSRFLKITNCHNNDLILFDYLHHCGQKTSSEWLDIFSDDCLYGFLQNEAEQLINALFKIKHIDFFKDD